MIEGTPNQTRIETQAEREMVGVEEVRQLLTRIGVSFDRIEVPRGGYSGGIFRIVQGSDVAYVRVGAKEKIEIIGALTQIATSHHIPVPEMTNVGYDEQLQVGYLIQREASGSDLASYRGDPILLSTLLPRAASLLREIHTVQFEGYGNFQHVDGHISGQKETWDDFLQKRKPNLEYLMSQDLIREDTQRMFEESYARLRALTHVPHSLLHNDYHPEHVFSDGENITGVIDWESAFIGDPYYDLAVSVYFLDDERREAFLGGYGDDIDQARLDDYLFLVHLVKLQWASKNTIPTLERKKRDFQRFIDLRRAVP